MALVEREELKELVTRLKQEGLKIVFTNGCFDLLHPGHLELLTRAKEKGDILLVGVNSDLSVQRLKGPKRPIFPEQVRAKMLASLKCVDWVTIFTEDTAETLLKIIQPSIYVKGGDYQEGKLPEQELVEALALELVFIPLLDAYSTTNILKALRD